MKGNRVRCHFVQPPYLAPGLMGVIRCAEIIDEHPLRRLIQPLQLLTVYLIQIPGCTRGYSNFSPSGLWYDVTNESSERVAAIGCLFQRDYCKSENQW